MSIEQAITDTVEQATLEALKGLKPAIERQIRDAFYRLTVRRPELLEGFIEAGIGAAGSGLKEKVGQMLVATAPDLLSKQGRKSTDAFQKLRHLMGYIENGTSGSVKIYQDDATRSYGVSVGTESWHGDTLEQAINEAYGAMPKDEEGYPT